LASVPDFSRILVQRTDLLARTAHDGCVKVRVNGLQPGTHYWFRLTYNAANRSAIGRTKTALAPNGVIRGEGLPARVVDATATSINRFYRVALVE
jgi:phosphodiesterase/alkaline phosphatase D-like protein